MQWAASCRLAFVFFALIFLANVGTKSYQFIRHDGGGKLITIGFSSSTDNHGKPILKGELSDQLTCPDNISDLIRCPTVKHVRNNRAKSVPCAVCIPHLNVLNKVFYPEDQSQSNLFGSFSKNQFIVNISDRGNKKPIYVQIVAPPDFGSSVLYNILGTSPSTSTMCKGFTTRGNIPWQCESQWFLKEYGAITRPEGYPEWNIHGGKNPDWFPFRFFSESTNWTRVYEIYDKVSPWVHPKAPILLDKSPSNIGKIKSMVDFYETNSMEYKIIAMMRSPCRKDWQYKQYKQVQYREFVPDWFRYIPKSNRFFINYDDLISRPEIVITSLLNWMPSLHSLALNIDGFSEELKPLKQSATINNTKNGQTSMRVGIKDIEESILRRYRRGLWGMQKQTFKDYVLSPACKLKIKAGKRHVDAREMLLWEHFNAEAQSYLDLFSGNR